MRTSIKRYPRTFKDTLRKDEYKIIKKRKDVEEREKTKKGEKKRIENDEKT